MGKHNKNLYDLNFCIKITGKFYTDVKKYKGMHNLSVLIVRFINAQYHNVSPHYNHMRKISSRSWVLNSSISNTLRK